MKKLALSILTIALSGVLMVSSCKKETNSQVRETQTKIEASSPISNYAKLDTFAKLSVQHQLSISNLSNEGYCDYTNILNSNLSAEAKAEMFANHTELQNLYGQFTELKDFISNNSTLSSTLQINTYKEYLADKIIEEHGLGDILLVPNVDPCGNYKAGLRSCGLNFAGCAVGAFATGGWAGFILIGFCYAIHDDCIAGWDRQFPNCTSLRSEYQNYRGKMEAKSELDCYN